MTPGPPPQPAGPGWPIPPGPHPPAIICCCWSPPQWPPLPPPPRETPFWLPPPEEEGMEEEADPDEALRFDVEVAVGAVEAKEGTNSLARGLSVKGFALTLRVLLMAGLAGFSSSLLVSFSRVPSLSLSLLASAFSSAVLSGLALAAAAGVSVVVAAGSSEFSETSASDGLFFAASSVAAALPPGASLLVFSGTAPDPASIWPCTAATPAPFMLQAGMEGPLEVVFAGGAGSERITEEYLSSSSIPESSTARPRSSARCLLVGAICPRSISRAMRDASASEILEPRLSKVVVYIASSKEDSTPYIFELTANWSQPW
mmetsp:Transcript_14142/g.40078  ORF Transcript_14142/g.40078 Transcript_14142/m.40078 type:complete len:316 (-) Transcript_14142:127-1074(-)